MWLDKTASLCVGIKFVVLARARVRVRVRVGASIRIPRQIRHKSDADPVQLPRKVPPKLLLCLSHVIR